MRRSLTLLAWAAFIIAVVARDGGRRYLPPRQEPILIAAAVCLVLVSLLSLRRRVATDATGRWTSALNDAVHVLPIAVALIAAVSAAPPPLPTGGAMAFAAVRPSSASAPTPTVSFTPRGALVGSPQAAPTTARGMSGSTSSSGIVLPRSLGAAMADEVGASRGAFQQIEAAPVVAGRRTLSALDLAVDPDGYADQPVEVLGTIVELRDAQRATLDPTQASGFRHALARMVITCCAADARPAYVLLVEPVPALPAGATWVRLRGRVAAPVRTVAAGSVPALVAETIEATAAPDDPYLYYR